MSGCITLRHIQRSGDLLLKLRIESMTMAPVNLGWGNPWGLRTLKFHFFDCFFERREPISMALTHHYFTFNQWENILSKFQSKFEWYAWIETGEKVSLAGKTNIDLSCFYTFGMRKSWRNTRAPWLPNSSRSKATRIIENLNRRVIWNIECLASSLLLRQSKIINILVSALAMG